MKSLKEQIEVIRSSFETDLKSAQSLQDLERVRITYLGRSGSIAQLMDHLKIMPAEEKRSYGPLIQELKNSAQTLFDDQKKQLQDQLDQRAQLQKEHFDVTATHYHPLAGSLHVYTHIIQRLEDIFISMGYEIMDGPEVENEFYNFTAVNVPENHPARDMQDTFWINYPHTLLRTHTTSVQVHTMENRKPPIAIFAPGRVYRSEQTDASHDFMFTQGEAMFIDKNVSMANLLATTRTFLQNIFDKKDLDIRVRPNYYPFVEPGIDIDGSCPFCKNGCSVCKHTGWIELMGAGLVHPTVLRNGGIDPDIYSGFALGFGIERLAFITYGINDIRLFHSSKIPFLAQF